MGKRRAPKTPPHWGGRRVREDLDDTPVEMPMGYNHPRPLHELIASLVRQAVADENDEEYETQEEADDFEEEEAGLLDMSPYELTEVPDDDPIPFDPEPRGEPKEPPPADPPDPNAVEPVQATP